MSDNELYAVFNPTFLEDIETLGNSVIVSDYYIEDLRIDITDINEILSDNFPVYRYTDNIPTVGFWDEDRKELKVHISLSDGVFSNKVKESSVSTIDPEQFEWESKNSSGINNGDGLVRVIRFMYTKAGKFDTAFILTGNITRGRGRRIVIEPIMCNQDKILITIRFPETTKANVKASSIEKDTEFLEGFAISRGDNIFRTYSDNTLGTRDSSYRYLDCVISNTDITKKDVPYIGSDGCGVYRRDNIRIYTSIDITCANLITTIRPRTRAALNIDGGILRIYGTLHYLEYEALGTELKYVGEGTESIDGIPDSELILTPHEGGLRDVSVNGFYVSYGKYEGQPDPSVLVKARVEFWNPFTKTIESIESSNIRLTQEENVISQWEVIYRSTNYVEPTSDGDIPVYMFPWESNYVHTFTIRTTLPNIRIDRDFVMEYADPILESYFEYSIERIPNRTYPITDYVVTIRSITDNLDPIKWLPIIDGESDIRLSTLRLLDYDYTESFYYVQSPKLDALEIHDTNDNNITEIVLEYNQDIVEYFPVAVEAREPQEMGERNSWKIIDINPRVIPESSYGFLNPNNQEFFENRLILNVSDTPNSIEEIDLGKIVLGRIKESEHSNNFYDNEWRNIVSLYKISIPIKKRGIIERITATETLVLKEINLYKTKVICNGPFACWMEENNDYCFFDPMTNQPTHNNHFYSRSFNSTDGVYVYIALHNTIAQNEEPLEENTIFFTVVEREPDWSNGKPSCFDDEENLATCTVYRQAPDEVIVDYVDPLDIYVFLGPYTEESIRYKSSETPVIDRLQLLENSEINQQFESYRTYSYNPITILDASTPIFKIGEDYKYHIQHIQNPNDLYDYYPITPCCIYRAHSYNYPDIMCPFYIFRKALGPSFYRSDSSTGNTIFTVDDPSGTDSEDRERVITIRSRYEIREEEFTIDYTVQDSFEISSIVHVFLDTSDYKHQYRITINTLLQNTGEQRPLGVISIVSRIYNLVNFTSSESIEVPYVELTQNDIDSIIQPAIMRISVVQEAGNGGNTGEIRVIGNRQAGVSNAGETRSFSIVSDVPIDMPEITNITGCSISGISTSGFSFTVPPLVDSFEPVIPSESSFYTTYTEPNNVSFDLLINPTDNLTYQSYSESFLFRQSGITSGLIFSTTTQSDTPMLYLGTNSVSYKVSASTTSLGIFLGVFGISSQISSGTEGTIKGIVIKTEPSCSYDVIGGNSCYYRDNGWKTNISLEFPENKTGKQVDRVFTVTYNDSGITHKIIITIKQESYSGNIICNNNAYFLSHGECIETDDYSDSMGFFTFDTDLDIKTLSLSIPKALYESYSFIYVGPSTLGGSYRTYKAQIKLIPNLSNSTIGNQIFSFMKNGESIRNVYINQGFYCLSICYPNETTSDTFSGMALGSEENPIEVPSRNNLVNGSRKTFKLILKRSEPIPSTGEFTEETINFSDIYFPSVQNCTWAYAGKRSNNSATTTNIESDSISNSEDSNFSQQVNTSGTSGEFLSNYYTELFQNDPSVNPIYYPFLENVYSVYPRYYTSELPIVINLSIIVEYPYDDPLYISKRNTTHYYTIYLRKVAEL